MVQEGTIPAMIELLRSRNGKLHEHACVTLRNLAINQDNEQTIAEQGALQPLVQVSGRVKVCTRKE
jgi:hypothetical protein